MSLPISRTPSKHHHPHPHPSTYRLYARYLKRSRCLYHLLLITLTISILYLIFTYIRCNSTHPTNIDIHKTTQSEISSASFFTPTCHRVTTHKSCPCNITHLKTQLLSAIESYNNHPATLATCNITTTPRDHKIYNPLMNNTTLFIALNLHNNAPILANTFMSLLSIIESVGCEGVFVSIVENGSVDSTRVLLRLFEKVLGVLRRNMNPRRGAFEYDDDEIRFNSKFGYNISLSPSITNWKRVHRIEALAALRNQAMEPLYTTPTKYDHILFINDIVFCPNDVYELVYQRVFQRAHFVCPMDYALWPDGLTYYDVWVGRDMNGSAFFPPVNNHWQSGQQLLPGHGISRQRFKQGLPFQVYSCWNGMSVLDPKPFELGVRFRRSVAVRGECSASECFNVCKDFWKVGFGRGVVVPAVGVGYEFGTYAEIQKSFGIAAGLKDGKLGRAEERIGFVKDPPERVVCYPLEGVGRYECDWGNAIWEEV